MGMSGKKAAAAAAKNNKPAIDTCIVYAYVVVVEIAENVEYLSIC